MSEMILIRGPIGAGKTSVASALCEQLPNASAIEVDAIKRMIDPRESSEWRRDIALRSSAFLASQLLEIDRWVIAEVHANRPAQLALFECVAREQDAILTTALLLPPLDVCIIRAQSRYVPGIRYQIGREMVEDYYRGIEPLAGEPVFDTLTDTPEEIAYHLLQSIAVKI